MSAFRKHPFCLGGTKSALVKKNFFFAIFTQPSEILGRRGVLLNVSVISNYSISSLHLLLWGTNCVVRLFFQH